jgi:hypothetical protein
MQTGAMISVCEGCDGLPPGAALKPIQIQDPIAGAPQPSANFSHLKRPIRRAEVAIYQLGYFLNGARLPDLVQRSHDLFVKTGIRVRRLAHLVFRTGKAKLMKPAEVVSCFAAHPLIKDGRAHEELLGTNWTINLRIASGSCSPASPANVYVRSNPLGP